MEEKVKELQKLIDDSSKIVFFGGAGVSTESGIPDFRSVDGLYNQKWRYPPETILSASFFSSNTKEFYRFYREKLLVSGIEPNAAHRKLAELEKAGKLLGIVTQNIDGLHQAAGSEKVWELHGSVLRNYCTKCGDFFDDNYIRENQEKKGIPKCNKCGATIKPDVILYEEPLKDRIVEGALKAITNADLLIIGGTSLTVYPAAGMVRYFNGNKIVLINRDPTQSDDIADLVIHDSIGKILSQIKV
ncbi:NAD-dependent protein deacylase [Treponema sp.]|uniref:NAD-dependent protein deacylase n=1 Tax=Treponema sp. TaxID=166 RepID=UPI001D9E4BCA|nr:NAD-dependent protein deacylase [Treponema sp.]MBS7241371.1 NAD-dependent protein deacylase [Treponema sp.]MCI6442175.1 NAD-dependent protein deacylase [Spirochaetia bacterium]MDY4133484.1 NAD-dependent protein deacylase [Treponema sp.]